MSQNVKEIKPTPIQAEVRSLNQFPTVSVPENIIRFIDENYANEVDYGELSTASKYPILTKYFEQKGYADVPTFNQWIYFFNIYHRQKLVDDLVSGMNEYNKKGADALATGDEDTANACFKKVKNFEFRYNEMSKDLLKYTNDGLNRETTKKFEGTVRHINAKDVVSIMNEPFVEGEYNLKEGEDK